MQRRRLFVAITIPEKLQRKLFDAAGEWRELPVRWTRQENLHVTLLFIGYADDDELSRIAASLPLAVDGVKAFEITLNHIGVGPQPKNPRMVWVEGETPLELLRLQQQVQDAVFSEGRWVAADDDGSGEDEKPIDSARGKPFRPHITLGRMIPFKWRQLPSVPVIEKEISIAFPVSSIELMESELGPKGPTYSVLSSVQLG